MKTKITLELDSDLLRELRVLAAGQGISITALLCERLDQLVREKKSYDRARRRAMSRLRRGFDLQWRKPCRDDLHER